MFYFLWAWVILTCPLYAGPHGANIHLRPTPPPSAVSEKKPDAKTLATLPTAKPTAAATAAPAPEPFRLGIERLAANNFDLLQGHRVGLLTHAAAVDSKGVSTIEILHKAPGVKLIALYAPEHGLDGQIAADKNFGDSTHASTGLPIRSVYGKTRKPTREMLSDIDLMVIDLQDIGVRSYTFASAMKLAMEACFEQNIPVVVLDRPNPLGGLKVDGPVLDPKWRSYVGALEVPYVHGLTLGELARLAQEELRPLKGSLTVVAMTGWHRRMIWPDLPLTWTPTSPAITSVSAAYGYACTGLGAQLGGFRHGYGTDYPFRLLSHPKIPTPILLKRLQAARIPGISFGLAKPTKGDEGVYVRVDNWTSAGAIEMSLTMLQIAQETQGSQVFQKASKNDSDLFCKHWGRDEPLKSLKHGRINAVRLANHWRAQALRWQATTGQRYWIYR